jgi:hypothetical protein
MNRTLGSTLLIVGQALLFATALQGGEIQLPAKENFYLFLLMGQSNMAAERSVDDRDREVAGRILVFDPSGTKGWLASTAADGKDPVRYPVGPGFGFAAELARKYPQITVGLIPVAVGGSGLNSWEKGAGNYKTAVARVELVAKTGVLKGVLWHLGETDAYRTNDDPHSYGKRLAQMIADLRAELKSPDLPFVVGQIGHWVARKRSFAFAGIINQQLTAIPSQVKRTACAASDGLGHEGGNLHFNPAASHEFGRRYAAAYLGVTAGARQEKDSADSKGVTPDNAAPHDNNVPPAEANKK